MNKKKRIKMHIFNFAVASLATTVKGSYFIQIQWLMPSVRIFGFLRSGVFGDNHDFTVQRFMNTRFNRLLWREKSL